LNFREGITTVTTDDAANPFAGLTAEQIAKIKHATASGPPLTPGERDILAVLFAEDEPVIPTCAGSVPPEAMEE
jgi:hypothetical protein